jgi:hypothetical protein
MADRLLLRRGMTYRRREDFYFSEGPAVALRRYIDVVLHNEGVLKKWLLGETPSEWLVGPGLFQHLPRSIAPDAVNDLSEQRVQLALYWAERRRKQQALNAMIDHVAPCYPDGPQYLSEYFVPGDEPGMSRQRAVKLAWREKRVGRLTGLRSGLLPFGNPPRLQELGRDTPDLSPIVGRAPWFD